MHSIIYSEPTPINKNYSREIRSIVQECLSKEPEKRPSIKELLQRKYLKNMRKKYIGKKDIKLFSDISSKNKSRKYNIEISTNNNYLPTSSSSNDKSNINSY
jgi:serine/threonine protein kinase